MRLATILLACLLTTACKQKTDTTTAATPDASIANSVHAASPVDDTPTHERGTVAPTDKPSQDARVPDTGTAQVAHDAGSGSGHAAPHLNTDAEVEIMGEITDVPANSTVFVAVSKKPCAADDAELSAYGIEKSPSPNAFFIEVFVPQGTEGWLCVYALRGTDLVAFATGDKNPMMMKGGGEVMFPGTKVKLKSFAPKTAPRALSALQPKSPPG